MYYTTYLYIAAAIIFFIYIGFSLSVRRAFQNIPKEQHYFPGWFAWLMLVPIVGYVFSWLTLPFGIPKTLASINTESQAIKHHCNLLFGLGLTSVIIMAFGWIPLIGLLFMALALILFCVYWYKLITFRKQYLDA